MEYIKTRIAENTLEIRFYNDKANSFTSPMLRELYSILVDANTNNVIKSILLLSDNPKLFSAGASFDEMLSIEDSDKAIEFFSGFARVIEAMINSKKLIITVVEGKSIGGSVGLVAASDYVVASPKAEFRLSEYSVGIGPFVIAPVIEKKIGKSPLMEMTIDTNYKSAEWALARNLVNVVTENPTPNEFAINLCNQINQRSNAAMVELKSMFWEWNCWKTDIFMERAHISAKLLLTEETKLFLKSFKSR